MKLSQLMKHQSRQENLIYLAMWGMLFAAPLLSLYLRATTSDYAEFNWHEVFSVWQHFSVYLLLFLIHNFLLAPLLVHRHKRWQYIAGVVVLVCCFVAFQCSTRPRGAFRGPQHGRMYNPQHGKTHDMRHDERPRHDDADFNEQERPPFDDGFERLQPEGKHKFRHRPPAIIGEHDIVSVLVLILLFGANLGIKGYFRSRRDQKKLTELERQNLEQQLEYLKYQINPHFFMNTLNNIHALVDIDPDKAKDTIVELSKMMRFVLYEGDKHGVPLSREFDFIRNYVTLMRLRYTDRVKITMELPTETPDRTVPPLMLISFIENAFKHGISYQRDSFIDIRATTDGDKLHFSCRNSKADKPNQEKGGVGLANVKQRLHLLYDNNFTLNIQDEADIYNVELTIPLDRHIDKPVKQ